MKKINALFVLLAFSSLVFQIKNVYSASAISVPIEARGTADVAKGAAEEIKQNRQNEKYRSEVEKNTVSSKQEEQRAQQQTNDTQMRLAAAKEALVKAEQEKTVATQQAQVAYKEAQDLDNQVAQARAKANSAQAQVQTNSEYVQPTQNNAQSTQLDKQTNSIAYYNNDNANSQSNQNSGVIEDELLQAERQFKQLEQEQKYLDNARSTDQPTTTVTNTNNASNNSYYSNQARILSNNAYVLEQQLKEKWRIVEEKKQAQKTAEDKYQATKKQVDDVEFEYNNNNTYLVKARDYAMQTLTELNRVVSYINNPGGASFMSVGSKYYGWSANDNVKGHQFVQPMYVGYWSKKLSYGFFTNHVSSSSKTPGETGSYNGFTDSLFLISKRQDYNKHFFADYSLGINIPTGKSAMSWGQRYARFNEDLVGIEQFGKGWQFTPGLNLNWRPYERDTWTIGTNYIYSRSYDPTSDIFNDTVKPGGEWYNFLRYQHAGEKWQFVAKILNTSYGRTTVSNGDSYKTKSKWEYQLTVNTKLSKTQDLMFYYWPGWQNRADLPFSQSTSIAHYYGTMWSKKLDTKSTLRLSVDVLNTKGARYTGIYNTYDATGKPTYTARDVDGRKKLTLGVGYDYKIDKKSNLSIDVQHFKMKDGKSNLGDPARNYKGFNVFLMYNRNI